MRAIHRENHRTEHIGWLRAAVLGANDGIVSTASLIVGVTAADISHHTLMITGVAGLVSGAMSMAAGEFVSVKSQADTESADLAREQLELQQDPASEQLELTALYIKRGLSPELAEQVATTLMAHDPLVTHAREELGISAPFTAKPVQAALASASSFAVGAALPLSVAAFAPLPFMLHWVSGASLIFLALLGSIAAKVGGASVLKGAWRVTFWGMLAMAVTAGVGRVFGAVG